MRQSVKRKNAAVVGLEFPGPAHAGAAAGGARRDDSNAEHAKHAENFPGKTSADSAISALKPVSAASTRGAEQAERAGTIWTPSAPGTQRTLLSCGLKRIRLRTISASAPCRGVVPRGGVPSSSRGGVSLLRPRVYLHARQPAGAP